jgi:hypothetical protein
MPSLRDLMMVVGVVRRLRCATPPVMHHVVASATKIELMMALSFILYCSSGSYLEKMVG